MNREPKIVDGKTEFRMRYTVDGEPKTIMWKPEPGNESPADFAVFLMSQVRPECNYKGRTSKGMKDVLQRNGIVVLVSSELNYGGSEPEPSAKGLER